MAETTRKKILAEAEKCVCSDREMDCGTHEDSFYKISKLWNAYLGDNVTDEHDVAMMMALVKVGRIASGEVNQDTYVDMAGYAALAGELAQKGEPIAMTAKEMDAVKAAAEPCLTVWDHMRAGSAEAMAKLLSGEPECKDRKCPEDYNCYGCFADWLNSPYKEDK